MNAISNDKQLLDIIATAEKSNRTFSVSYISQSKGGVATLVCMGEYHRRSRVQSQHAIGAVEKAESVREIPNGSHLFTLAELREGRDKVTGKTISKCQCRELKLDNITALTINGETYIVAMI